VPLLNVLSIIGTYPYTKYLRTDCINKVASKPGNHEFLFQLYKFNEEFKSRLDSKIRDASRSRVCAFRFAIGECKI